MTLIKTSLLNAIAVAIRMLTMLGLNKILAIYVGPAGYAAIGNFQNAVQMISTFGSGAINTGVVKYTAEYGDDEAAQRKVWQTAGTVALAGSLIAGVLVAVFSKPLAQWFLKDEIYSPVFLWFAVTLVFFVFNTLLLAILNGKKEIQRYIVANIAGSLFSLVATTLLTIQFGLMGALIALAIYPSFAFVVTLLLCHKTGWFKLSYLFGRPDKQVVLNLAKFMVMALTSAACVPVSHILIRNHLGTTLGWETAGYWEAMWRVSTAYLMLVTTTLSIYYLPRLAELKKTNEIKQEILQGYKLILPVAVTCGLIIYLLRDFIISVLFTAEFTAMRNFFAWQVLGDTLKIAAWLLGYVLTAKAMMRVFVLVEVFFSLLFLLQTYLFTALFKGEGVVIAYAVNNGFLFVFLYIFVVYRESYE